MAPDSRDPLRIAAAPHRLRDRRHRPGRRSAQECFAIALVRLDSFDGKAPFVAWLPGIAHHLVRKHWRKAGNLDRRLAALDRRGQSQWRAHQLRSAETPFWRIVNVGGRHRRVEMAFAELFALVRQRRGEMSRVWTRYLHHFSKGTLR